MDVCVLRGYCSKSGKRALNLPILGAIRDTRDFLPEVNPGIEGATSPVTC
jgi:hypothetical protein